MSHDPSKNLGLRAIQIDINGASVVSDDIAVHTKTTFNAKNIYLIEHRYLLTSSSSIAGFLLYSRFTGFSFMGGLTRANTVSGVNTALDNLFCGVNSRNTDLTISETSTGSGTITGTTFKSYWRIL